MLSPGSVKNRGCFLYWKRWSLRPQRPSAPSLRRFVRRPNLLRFSASVRFDLRSLSPGARGASNLPSGIVRAVVAALLFSGAGCSLAVNLPPPRTASPSGQLPMLRPSAGSASRPSRRSSSPADFPPVRSAPQTLRVDRGERYARPAQHGSVPPPFTSRIQPPQAPAEPASFRLRRCAGLSRPSLPFAHSRNPFPFRCAPRKRIPSVRFPPLRSLSGNLPVLRTASAGSGRAPLRQIPFQSAPLQRCSPRLPRPPSAPCHFRGTASAGSGRTPFVLTPPLRPAQAQARFGSASGQPAHSLPPAAGVPQATQPAPGVRSMGRLPFRLDSRRAPINLPVRSRPRPALRRLRSRPAASVPGQIDLRAHYRFLPGNLLRLRPSSAPAAAPATIARRACFPSAPGGLRIRRLPSSALCTGVFLCRSGLRHRQALAPLRLQMLRQAPQLQLLLRSSLGARLRPPLRRHKLHIHSLSSHSCRKLSHSAAPPCPVKACFAGSPVLCFAVPPPAVPVPQAPPERSPAQLYPAHPTVLSLRSAAFHCAALRRGAPTSRSRVGRRRVSVPFRSAPGKNGCPISLCSMCGRSACLLRYPVLKQMSKRKPTFSGGFFLMFCFSLIY